MPSDVPQHAGLCASCLHSRSVTTPRSRFVLCERSRADATFVRYPRLPVLACAGFEGGGVGPSDTSAESESGPPQK